MKLKDILAKAIGIETTGKRGGNAIKSISIVNCNNGKRLTLSASLFEELGQPETVKCAVDTEDKYLIMASDIDSVTMEYKVSNKGKGIIYNSALVSYIAESFSLDFSGKTSMSFNKIKLKEMNGIMTAFIKID